MYARVITAQSTRSKVEQAVATYESSVIPEASKLKGFKNAYLLVSPATGQAMSVVLWETEDDMIASEKSEYLRGQIAKFGAIFDATPMIEHYEVRASA
jgi:heme-degrading monooxygenase HmoA